MVRSKSENQRRDLFHLSDKFRAAEKYFDVSRDEIDRELNRKGKCEHICVQEVDDDDGQAAAELKLNINCRGPYPSTWTIALKLHNERIDGIDWEGGPGWHRHDWNPVKRKATRKEAVAGFDDPGLTREDFVVRACKEMRILLSKNDYGLDADLLFD